MSTLRNTSRFLQFTNNVQMARKQSAPASFPQSLSGSETDISTSNENLSNEERYVIRHTTRVEPQGQENMQDGSNRNSLKESLQGSSNRSSLKESIGGGPNSNRSSLDVSSSSYNTLIIHNAGQDDQWTGRLSGIRDHPSNLSSHSSSQSPSYHSMLGQGSGIPLSMGAKDRNSLPRNSAFLDRSFSTRSDGVQEINEIPDDYLNQSSVLKHLAKEVNSSAHSPSSRSPSAPPAPPAGSQASGPSPSPSPSAGPSARRARALNKEKLNLSRSQPDLSSVGVGVRPLPGGSEAWDSCEVDDIGCYTDMLDLLVQENSQLKGQLDDAWQKIAKSHKLEEEVSKVHRAHEELVGSCERRERLERAARGRLQSDCRRLHDINRALREQVELLSGQVMRPLDAMTPTSDMLRKELQNREMLIAQLITQNKELVCAKERQEIEIAAQRATLQEQRTHIDILDTALTNAQSNVVRLEEECRHAQGYVERVAQLQRALASLQQASDRRELTERKLRSQLEKELQTQRSRDGSAGPGSGGEGELRRALREKEERLLVLEGECAKWEQRYLEEATLRQAAIDAASIPKDAKIAALEKTSQETDRLMAEARSEKIRHMDELHSAQKKCADLESRLKELESKVAERDAMIKVLQKHTQSQAGTMSYASDASDSHYNTHSHTHSLRNNSSREELGFGASSSAASFSSQDTVPLYHGGVRGSPSPAPPASASPSPALKGLVSKYGSTTTSLSKPSAAQDPTSFEGKKRTLDDQLAKLDSQLDSQLLSKRGLCCFPAFSGASTGPRKGKLSKPLTGSTGTATLFEPSFLGNLVTRPPHDQGRPEEIMLLEKQGLSSQQQRMQDAAENDARRSGSLPPSSLPRPPRKPSMRRFGEYGRLSDTEVKKNNGETNVSNGNRGSPSRPLLPQPRRLGEYGRLNDEPPSQRSLRKPSIRSGTPSVPGSSSPSTSNSRESLVKAIDVRNNSLRDSIMKNMSIGGTSSREALMKGGRDSGGSTTMSENSASSLPPPSRLQAMYSASQSRRGNSLNREGKSNERSINKYRIQF